MGDMGDAFRALRDHSKTKRQSNLEWSTQHLREQGVEFASSNGGIHLIVRHGGHVVDFWPSTGRFIFRANKAVQGRGIRNMLKRLGVEPK